MAIQVSRLDDVQKNHARLEAREQIGKSVMRIDSPL
jgi:hypothetical protein